jgi:hypothetical protein
MHLPWKNALCPGKMSSAMRRLRRVARIFMKILITP